MLGELEAGRLQASDAILLGPLTLGVVPKTEPHCVRYSRVPPGETGFAAAFNTTDEPLFVELDFPAGEGTVRRPANFGEPGAGVLHPSAPATVRLGAEDGGEMGAYHGRRYSLAAEAVRLKLEDFLPLGLEAVLIPDPRLLVAPPQLAED